jgi:hypothetical protein
MKTYCDIIELTLSELSLSELPSTHPDIDPKSTALEPFIKSNHLKKGNFKAKGSCLSDFKNRKMFKEYAYIGKMSTNENEIYVNVHEPFVM